jgi:hypothetical protein
MRDMRGRIDHERNRGPLPEGSRRVRFDPGGMMDIEFLLALGQLRHASDAGVRTTEPGVIIERLVALGWPATLREDYAWLRRVVLRLRLLQDRPQDVVSPRDVGPLSHSLDITPETLERLLDATMRRVRALFADEFGARTTAQ